MKIIDQFSSQERAQLLWKTSNLRRQHDAEAATIKQGKKRTYYVSTYD